MSLRSRRLHPHFRPRPAARLALLLALAAWPGAWPPPARGEPAPAVRRPFPRREASSTPRAPGAGAAASSGASGGWWMGTAGVALALAACGWASVAARKYRPGASAASAPLRVVGRTSLTPRHTVYLLEAGGRVLIVGTGPQGAPSLLGELTDPGPGSDPDGPPRAAPARFDRRLGPGGDDA